jgi:hypothetical protein
MSWTEPFSVLLDQYRTAFDIAQADGRHRNARSLRLAMDMIEQVGLMPDSARLHLLATLEKKEAASQKQCLAEQKPWEAQDHACAVSALKILRVALTGHEQGMMPYLEYVGRVAALKAKPMFSGQNFGFGFPPGWLGLIEKLVADLEALPGGDALRCVQLKEKWGSLRLYLDGEGLRMDFMSDQGLLSVTPGTDQPILQQAQVLIREAEKRSAGMCYLCGNEATMRQHGWVLPLCDTHDACDFRELVHGYESGGSAFNTNFFNKG